jgi:hypothetical protein
MEWYPWLVFAHVLGAFGFTLGHGVSVFAAFRLRAERDRGRIEALLDVSAMSLALLYGSLLLLLAGGIAAGFVGEWWDELWIWVSIGVLVVVLVVMWAVASPYYMGIRKDLGRNGGEPKPGEAPAPPLTDDALVARLASMRPYWLAAVGGIGLVAIIGLMVLKPG